MEAEPRYWMLETIRENVQERLELEDDGDALSQRQPTTLAPGRRKPGPSDGGRASTLEGAARDRA